MILNETSNWHPSPGRMHQRGELGWQMPPAPEAHGFKRVAFQSVRQFCLQELERDGGEHELIQVPMMRLVY